MKFLRPYKKGHLYNQDGSLYMRRWAIFETRWLSMRVHEIVTEDRDPLMHDHPWWFLSIVLRGSYVEARPYMDTEIIGYDHRAPRKERKRFSIAFRKENVRHRITKVSGNVVTLFIHGPERQEWGFFDPYRGKIPWREYLDSRKN